VSEKESLFLYRLTQSEETLKDALIIMNDCGSLRSVINRCYYAVFYSVLALFLKCNVSIKTSKHTGVISLFDKEFIITKKIDKKYSAIFHSLFDDRQEFDYREYSIVNEGDAKSAIADAENFIENVKDYISLH
jgi:uncharacterized protein (UPF0332 family)